MQGIAKYWRKSWYSVPQPLFFFFFSMALHIPAGYWYNHGMAFYSCHCCTHPLNCYLTDYCLLSYLMTFSLSFLSRYAQELYAFYKTVNEHRKWKPGLSEVSGNTSEFSGFYQGKKKINVLSKAVGVTSKITLRLLLYKSGITFKRTIPRIQLLALSFYESRWKPLYVPSCKHGYPGCCHHLSGRPELFVLKQPVCLQAQMPMAPSPRTPHKS